MRVAYVLAGPPASGKSTYVNQNYKTVNENVTVFSSDKIREDLFGDLTNPAIYTVTNHQKVFDELYKRATNATTNDIVIDSTNLSRKSRRRTYSMLKHSNFKVVVIAFIEPLAILLDRNSKRLNRVPEQKVRDMYISFEPPRVGVDCDSHEVVTTTPFLKGSLLNFLLCISTQGNVLKALQDYVNDDYLLELNKTYKEIPHDTPYHLETIEQHIQMCLDNIDAEGDTAELDFIASFHDLGKYVTKNGGRYYGHANVSAMYALNALATNNATNALGKEHIEVIFMHMLAHVGISDKTIKKNKLTTKELTLLSLFKDIDDKSRVTNID